jgi:hypothetical protein
MIDQKRKANKKKDSNIESTYYMIFRVVVPFDPSAPEKSTDCVERVTDAVISGLEVAAMDYDGIKLVHSTAWETSQRNIPIISKNA